MKHKWFCKNNGADISENRVKPPVSIDVLGLNIDEKEFVKGEEEFMEKIMND